MIGKWVKIWYVKFTLNHITCIWLIFLGSEFEANLDVIFGNIKLKQLLAQMLRFKFWSYFGAPNLAPKYDPQIWLPKYDPHIWLQNMTPKFDYKIDPQIWLQNMTPKFDSKIWLQNLSQQYIKYILPSDFAVK